MLLGAAGFCANISWQIVLPVLPLHLSHLGYSAAQIGMLVSVLSVTMAIVELQAGPIVSVLGRRWTLVTGFSANAACLVFAGTARTTGTVASALAAIGGARAVLVPPLHATVAESSTTTTRGRMFGLFWLWASAATLIGPVIGGLVAARYGDRAPFYLGSVFSALALPVIASVAAPRRTSPKVSLREVKDLLTNSGVLRLCAATLLCFSVAGLWTTFLPLHIARQGISVVVVGWVFTIQGAFYALMQVPTGRLITRVRGDRLAFAGIAGMAGTALAAPLLHTPFAFLVAGAVYGSGFGLIPVTFATRITWLIPQDKFTTAMGVYNSAIDFGLFLGPLLGGAVALLNAVSPFALALPLGLAASAMVLGAMGRGFAPGAKE